jgi:hypothetical protein
VGVFVTGHAVCFMKCKINTLRMSATFRVYGRLMKQAVSLLGATSGAKPLYVSLYTVGDRLCGLVVRVPGYISEGPDSIPGTTRKKSSGSGTGSTQPREYN